MKLLTLLLPIVLLISCSQEPEGSIFATAVQRDYGALEVMNESGFIGATIRDTTIEYELILKSTGGLDVKDIQVTLTTSDPIAYKGGAFPGTGGTCSDSLDKGETCTIVFEYSPVDTNSHAASLNFSYRDDLSPKSFSYTLSADSHPILSFNRGTLFDFGNKFIGSSTDLQIYITNIGRVNADNININNLSLPYSFKGGSYPGTGGNCTTQIVPGQSCLIVVNYSPTTSAEHLQDITLNYLNSGRPEDNTLNLKGWGFHPATLSISASGGWDFGDVASNSTHEKVITVTHSSGDVSGTGINLEGLNAPFSYKGGSFPGTGGTCGTTLTKDQGSCTMVVAMNSSTNTYHSMPLVFSYLNGQETITQNITIEGTTKDKAVLSFNDSGAFPVSPVNSSTTRTITITHTSGDLPATDITVVDIDAPFSRSGGTCSSTLSPGSCTIELSFSPTSHDIWSDSIRIRYNDGAQTLHSSYYSLTGKSQTNVDLQSTVNFGNEVVGQSKAGHTRIRHLGGVELTQIQSVSLTGPFSFTGGSFPGTGSYPCSSTHTTGSCYLYLNFTPPSEGVHTGELKYSYHDGISLKQKTVNLSGNGAPVASLTLSNVAFGSQSVNSSPVMMATVNNSTSMDATSVGTVSLPAGFQFQGGSYPGRDGTCGSTVHDSSTCTLAITFNPTAVQTYTDTLTLSYDDGVQTQTVSSTLSGTGVNSNDLFISNWDTVDFDSSYTWVGKYKEKTFTISHGGAATAATITNISVSGLDFTIESNDCPGTLNNGASCNIVVRFAPTSSGTKNGSIQLTYNNGSSQTTSRLLEGKGKMPALLTITPSPYDFDEVAQNSTTYKTFTVTHSGEVKARNMTSAFSGTGFSFRGSYPGYGGNCGSELNHGNSCTIVGKFNPSSTGAHTGQIGVEYNNGFETTQTMVDVTGEAIPTASLSILTNTNFGDLIQTTTAERTITITHSGSVPATNISAVPLSAPFSFKDGAYPGTGGDCADTLSSGSCTVVVVFAPTSTGTKQQQLRINYHNGFSSTSRYRTLRGESLAQAIISISESDPYNMGTVNAGAFIDKAFTLSNGGDVTGTNIAGAFEDPQFKFKGGSFPGTGGSCSTTLASGSTCDVIVRFTPDQAQSYSTFFTLNYDDGLRTQTEQKILTGTGSSGMHASAYMQQIPIQQMYFDPYHGDRRSAMSIGDVNTNGHGDALYTFFNKPKTFFALDGASEKLIFRTRNLLPKGLYQGVSTTITEQDLNGDGHPEFLDGIYKKEQEILKLVGFDLRCSKTGNILKRYITPSDQ
ncbi:MAG: hypothetical protein CME64_07955 [Halobacteriovoraceae bacterium]|nr:hypothetical protein [Halobacteriovoraceae bacterium]|tara:strand:+ start:136489 stop:140331 length:3843 start_codon:yes stop_codon:yes gene_type:complete